MADSTTNIPQIYAAQEQKEVTANGNFDSASPVMIYGNNQYTTTGLTWGYLGGRIYIDGTATTVANATIALTASSTNYVEISAAGTVSKNTTAFSADKAPLYKVVTGTSSITTYEDHRNPLTFARLFYGRLSLAMADANKTLTNAQAMCDSIECTGALTALRDVIVPTVERPYTVYAGTTGFGVRVKTSGGTGITLAIGDRVTLECDGTNVVAVGSAGAGGFTGGTLITSINEAPIVTIASSATPAIGAAAGNTISITGTTTITGFDTIASGAKRTVTFTGALTLTHNGTSLILPSGANITTAAGDCAEFVSLGSGNWRCTNYETASGASLVASTGRELLTAARTYYVRTDGSDSNNGLANTSGGAFLTIQKAIDVVCGIDHSIYDVTIQVGDGTYTGTNLLKPHLGGGTVSITGNVGTPANVLISTTSANCFSGVNCGAWTISNLKMQAATSGTGITSTGATIITFSNLVFGQCVSNHMRAERSGSIISSGNYSITAGSSGGAHMYAVSGGNYSITSKTVTLTGTPAFGAAFAWCDRGLGYFELFSNTYSGAATGLRYVINNNAVCFTNAAGATYFPGSIAGTVTNGLYA